ncbi:MAG: methionine--tRNA ligase [Candidatus Verstraetearchaeota archaeon]|nr:methionine--tRNA ligase [Candidatus Verstraetearchaeota archaeon]
MRRVAKWIVTCAWPYVNYIPHLGTMIGSALSADVIARYLRMRGEDVIFVSGSDEHGTPIEVEAIKRGVEPKALCDENHAKIAELFEKWGISFDNYSRTESQYHKEFVMSFYMKVYEKGYVYEEEVELPFCPRCQIFLPDRFVVGECPYCGFEDARGDQCDNCGRLLEPNRLVRPKCAICSSSPQFKKTKHWFFDLPKLEQKLREYIERAPFLTENARNMSISLLNEGLKPRSLTRDNKWGIPAPFPGAEGKTIYVWMEAVLGYISATIEFFVKKGMPEKWKEYWFDKDAKFLCFIGKDNIPFHTLILPALLMASGEGYVLPWGVSATEYLLFEGQKFSKSRRIGVWIDEALEMYPVDYWRYVLLCLRPEGRDVSFTWALFKELVNSHLNDTLGNFIYRVLSFTSRAFNSRVPAPRESWTNEELWKATLEKFELCTSNLDNFKIRDALQSVMDLAREGNRYLNEKAPWEAVKQGRKEEASTSIYVCINAIKSLAIMLAPFMPNTSAEIWRGLGFTSNIHGEKWREAVKPIEPGRELPPPKPLFAKIR